MLFLILGMFSKIRMKFTDYTFFYKQRFFQLILSVA